MQRFKPQVIELEERDLVVIENARYNCMYPKVVTSNQNMN